MRLLLLSFAICMLMVPAVQAAPCNVSIKNYEDSANHSDALMKCVLEGRDPPKALLTTGGKGQGYSGTSSLKGTTAWCPPGARCVSRVTNPNDNGDPGKVKTGLAQTSTGGGNGNGTGNGDNGSGNGNGNGSGNGGTGTGSCSVNIETDIPTGSGIIDLPCGGAVAIAGKRVTLKPGVDIIVVPVTGANITNSIIRGQAACEGKVLTVKRDTMHLLFDPATSAQFLLASNGDGLNVLAVAGQKAILPIGGNATGTRLEVDFGSVSDADGLILPDGGSFLIPGNPVPTMLAAGTRFNIDSGGNVVLPNADNTGTTTITVPATQMHGDHPYVILFAEGSLVLPAEAQLPVGATHAQQPNNVNVTCH